MTLVHQARPQRRERAVGRRVGAGPFRRFIGQLQEELLQVLPAAKSLPGSGQDQNSRLGIVSQILQRITHVIVHLGIHGIPLFGTV